MAERFDMLVVGAGPGGYVAALEAARLGARTALVEKEEVGGTCLNRGCIPTKALLASCKLYHEMQAQAASFGVRGEANGLDLAAALARKDKVVKIQRDGIRRLLAARKVSLFEGEARFTGEGTARVTARDGTETEVRAAKILIATGSAPATLPFLPFDEERILSSEGALSLKTPPEKPVIVGGGVQGCEWAAAFALMGLKVTLVEALPTLLPGEDEEATALLAREMKKLKVRLLLGVPLEGADLSGSNVKLKVAGGETLEADRVIVSVGRRPVTAGLGLEALGVSTKPAGGWIEVDPFLKTTGRDIWAVGDVIGPPLLAHAASAEGLRAVGNALGEKAEPLDRSAVPAAAFTFPEVAAVGLGEKEARERGGVKVGRFQMRALGRAHAEGRLEGFVKVVADEKSGQILGGRVVGQGAAEIIHVLALAVRSKLRLEDLAAIPFAHPTFSEAVGEAVLDAMGQGVHAPSGG